MPGSISYSDIILVLKRTMILGHILLAKEEEQKDLPFLSTTVNKPSWALPYLYSSPEKVQRKQSL